MVLRLVLGSKEGWVLLTSHGADRICRSGRCEAERGGHEVLGGAVHSAGRDWAPVSERWSDNHVTSVYSNRRVRCPTHPTVIAWRGPASTRDERGVWCPLEDGGGSGGKRKLLARPLVESIEG